ncbi:MAG: AIR synthase-related protein, partial [Solirubrobacteraceae bacterium]
PLDAHAAARACETVRSLVAAGTVHSAHDIAEGGLAVALAECCIAGEVGASVTLPDGMDPFAEAPGRAFVVSGPAHALAGLTVIGQVGGDDLRLRGLLTIGVRELAERRDRGLAEYL